MSNATDHLLSWGAHMQYMFVVLDHDEQDYLQRGEQAWRALLESGDQLRIGRLQKQYEKYCKWIEKEKRKYDTH